MWLPGLPATENSFQTSATTVTADGTPHTDGVWVELIASTPFDITMLGIQGSLTAVSGTQTGQLLDIAVGASSSEIELISDIPTGWSALFNRVAWFPVEIPAGTRIAVRVRAVIVDDTVDVSLWMYGGSSWEQPAFQSIDTIGAVLASSAGTSLLTGSIIELIASTVEDYKALGAVFDMGVDGDFGGGSGGRIEIFVGAGGSEKTLIGNIFFVAASSESVSAVLPQPGLIPIELNIPAGSRLSAQFVGSRDCGIVLFGFR